MDKCNKLFIRVKECNDEIALKQIMKIVNKWLPNYIFNIIKDKDKTNDIVQEAWITVWEKRDMFDYKSPFNGWIRKIARNIAFKSKPEEYFSIEEGEEGKILFSEYEKSTEQKIIETEREAILLKAINMLSKECKDLIFFKYFENYSYKNISNLLSLNFNYVRNHLHLCKMLLKTHLEKLGY